MNPYLYLVIIFLAIVLFMVARRIKDNYAMLKLMQQEADFIPNSVTGTLIQELQDLGHIGVEALKTLGKIVTTHPAPETGLGMTFAGNLLFPFPVMLPTRTEVVKAILSSKKRVDKGLSYQFLDIFGGGLIVSEKIRWAKTRKLLNPIFHQEMLKHFVPVMSDKCHNLVSKLAIRTANGPTLVSDFNELASETIMAMLLETVIGSSADDLDPQFRVCAEKLDKMQISRSQTSYKIVKPLYLLTKEGRSYHATLNFLKSESRKLIMNRIKKLRDEGNDYDTGRKPVLLDSLLNEHFKNPEVMTMEFMVGEILTFLEAGWDTTTWTATFLLQMVGSYPEVQQKIHQEIDLQLDGFSDDHLMTLEDVSKLSYLECVFYETLRYLPQVIVYMRHLYEDLQLEVDGKERTIPAGTEVAIDPDIIHRNPRYWKDPDRFMPERFLPENSAGRDPLAFLSFSFGPRGCIGKPFAMCEGKIFLAQIFRKFKVTSDTTIDQIIMDNTGVSRRSKEPIRFIFESRLKSE